MIPVTEALDAVLALAKPLDSEVVPLRAAAGRVLARPVTAGRAQPPFAASAMDGYAVRTADARPGATLQVIGEAAAGKRSDQIVQAGQALRIFTGAPLPEGADRVIIQEDVTAIGNHITLSETLDSAVYVRPRGQDFDEGFTLSPRRLGSAELALLAAMNIAEVPVVRRPTVALISTGDELVMPGQNPGEDQIVASNLFGLSAMIEAAGAQPRILPIANDTPDALRSSFYFAKGADVVVTIGGASVGDHDLVGDVARDLGAQLSFYKIAMRPGKPMMAGRLGPSAFLGLPGNPVSALVCGRVFLCPLIDALLGLPSHSDAPAQAPSLTDLPANGPRAHYMRAQLGPDGITAFPAQDSALLSVLAQSNALLIRPPHAPAIPAGTPVGYLPL